MRAGEQRVKPGLEDRSQFCDLSSVLPKLRAHVKLTPIFHRLFKLG
jgi:hypothetical protein